jgi:hypothetical protein
MPLIPVVQFEQIVFRPEPVVGRQFESVFDRFAVFVPGPGHILTTAVQRRSFTSSDGVDNAAFHRAEKRDFQHLSSKGRFFGQDELDDRHFDFRDNLFRPNLVDAPKQPHADVNDPPADLPEQQAVKMFIDAAEVPDEKNDGFVLKVLDIRDQLGLVEP